MKYKNNKLLRKTYDEGYRDGVHKGVYESIVHFSDTIVKLKGIKGIGPGIYNRILKFVEKETSFDVTQEIINDRENN